MPLARRAFLALVMAAAVSISGTARQSALQEPGFTTDQFFQIDKVWPVHLTFSADQWAAMQPRYSGGGGGFGGGFGGNLQGPEGARNGVSASRGIEFTYVHASLDIDGTTFPDVGVRYKGNGTFMRAQGTQKASLKIDLNKYVRGQHLASITTINLQNNITDIGWMNEVFSYRLYRDAGVPAPRTAYARVYVTVPGRFSRQFFGVYSISENVDEHFIETRFGTKKGAILKPSTRDPFTFLGNQWSAYNQTYDPKTDMTADEKARIIALCSFVSTASDADFAAHAADYVDFEEFSRYFAVLVWMANADSLLQMGQNYYVYLHPRTHKLNFIAWDQDGSFGNFSRSGNADSWSIYYPWNGNNTFLGRMYGVEAFRTLYLARLKEFTQTIFQPERFAAQLKEIGPAIRPSILTEDNGTWVTQFDRIADGQAGILPFARNRNQSVISQLANGR